MKLTLAIAKSVQSAIENFSTHLNVTPKGTRHINIKPDVATNSNSPPNIFS